MNIVRPSARILLEVMSMSIPEQQEFAGRICYKSEDRITDGSAVPFLEKAQKAGHDTVLEMAPISIEIALTKTQFVELSALSVFGYTKYIQIDYIETLPDHAGVFLATGSMRAWRELINVDIACSLRKSLIRLFKEKYPYSLVNIPDNILSNPLLEEFSEITIINFIDQKDIVNPINSYRYCSSIQKAHYWVPVKFIVNRAVSHELVRHRPVQVLQESQRYCRYGSGKFGEDISFIKPIFYKEGTPEFEVWKDSCLRSEKDYLLLLGSSSPQAARTALNNSCKTELIMYCSIGQWNHIFKRRCAQEAEPSMREVMIPLFEDFLKTFPVILS